MIPCTLLSPANFSPSCTHHSVSFVRQCKRLPLSAARLGSASCGFLPSGSSPISHPAACRSICSCRRQACRAHALQPQADGPDSEGRPQLEHEAEQGPLATSEPCRNPDGESDGEDETHLQLEGWKAAPVAAAGIGVADLKRQWNKLQDRIFYDDILPPTGSQQLSYARLLQLLQQKRVKRITLLSDGKVAIVEVPVEGFASVRTQPIYNRRNKFITYAEENPEWMIEKHRFYCELPGDIWEDGYFMNLVKMNQPFRDANNRVPYDHMLQTGQVTTELVVVDPGNQSVWLNQYVRQFTPILALLALRGVVGAGTWLVAKFGKKKKDRMQEMAEELGSHRAKEYNVGINAKRLGVKYDDVAGIDNVKGDIQVAMNMLLGAEAFRKIGAKPPRGILLEGPPGTGKTYLAKAMAGEAGVPFFSANGAEFVEMFQGVASARIRSLFAAARKVSPSIVFIDEIDAIGKARGEGGDSGTAEREQGLLQMLTEMDGFKRDDQVLVVGATNRAGLLDDALLRPGRFDRIIHMGRPSAPNRFKILQVHAKGKPIDRSGDAEHETDALLHKVAQLTIGYSGAELANLLNEAAILAVRRGHPDIDMGVLTEAMEKTTLGLRQAPLPDSEAKTRLTTLAAARAVCLTLTPGIPPIEHVTVRPRGGVGGRILFTPTEGGVQGTQLHKLYYDAGGNATMGTFEFCCRLLVPLYAARAAEEILYGRDGMTLSTSFEVARAGELAQWLCRSSSLHPRLRDTPMLYDMEMGGWTDPTTKGLEPFFEPMVRQLLRATYGRALALVRSRLSAISTVAQELLSNENEQISGARISQLLDSQPEDVLDADTASLLNDLRPMALSVGNASFRTSAGTCGAASFRQPVGPELSDMPDLLKAAQVIVGSRDPSELDGKSRVDIVREQLERLQQRQDAVEEYAASSNGAQFPPPPPDVDFEGILLSQWVPNVNVV